MNATAKRHLEKAKNFIEKGDEYYRKAKPEIDAAIEAGASQREVARFLARSRTWVQDVIAWDGEGTLYGKDTQARQIRMAKQVLSDEKLAKKVIASLDEDQREELVQVILDDEEMEEVIEEKQDIKVQRQLRKHKNENFRIKEIKTPLLHKIRGCRVRMNDAARAMVLHWHDGRHDVNEEEEYLVRDEMALAVVEVEKEITAALRDVVRG
jgi:hypothetical protein